MATAKELAMLAEAVRQLAKTDPEIRSAIEAAALRGDIPETEVRADIADSQDECCAEKGNGGGDDGPCDTPAGSIWCNPDEPWVDCETGKPVTMNPGGFPQGEGCKDCTEDEYWIPPDAEHPNGQKWGGSYSGLNFQPSAEAFARELGNLFYESIVNIVHGSYSYTFGNFATDGTPRRISFKYTIERISGDDEISGIATIYPTDCSASDEDCTGEPPENCGEDWTKDGTTDLAIIDGCITGSKCDPDASAGDQHCKKCRNLCGPSGQQIQVCAQPDGTFTAEDPSNPGHGTRYNRYGIKQYDYTPDIGS